MPLIALTENGLTYWCEPAEVETLAPLRDICVESTKLLEGYWGLALPRRCRVYVMTHWWHLMLHAASWPLRVFHILTLPLWYGSVRKVWILAAGLTMRYRKGPAVGVKPIRLWTVREDSPGKRIFLAETDDTVRMRNIVCHELTHAFTMHLRFPLWLNEGVAMITVDRFLHHETVIPSTLQLLRTQQHPVKPADYPQLAQMSEDAMIYAYVRGYWVTRYLHETCPGLLLLLLAERRSLRAMEREIALAVGLSPKIFWQEIDRLVLAHFVHM